MKTRFLTLLLIVFNQNLYAQFAASCLTDTINISSGYNHTAAATYPVSPSSASPTLDKYWLVTGIPTNTTSLTPTRCAELLTAKGLSDVGVSNTARAAWLGIVAYPYPSNTAQLSPTANFFWNCPPATPYTPTKTPITFTRNFYVQTIKSIDTISINVSNILGDDYVRVYLDGSVVILNPFSSTTFGTGPFNISLPVSSGLHTIDVQLWDVSGQLSGIRVDANISAKSNILVMNSCFGEASSTCSITVPGPSPCAGTTANFKDTNTSCYTFDFTDLSIAKDSGIVSWNWDFGDLSTSSLKNPSHTYADYGTYNVRLIVNDSSGCADTFNKSVSINYSHFANAGRDTFLCLNNGLASTILIGNGGTSYSWSPTTGLINPTAKNTTANISSATTYYLSVTNAFGCRDLDTVNINLHPIPMLTNAPKNAAVCVGSNLQLNVSGAKTYEWTPAAELDSAQKSNPWVKNIQSPKTLIVKGTDANGCIAFDTVNIRLNPAVVLSINPKNIAACATDTVSFNVSGALTYKWSPSEGLDNDSVANPKHFVSTNKTYYVKGKNAQGCEGMDSLLVILYPNPIVEAYAFANENIVRCQGDEVNLSATGASNYSWSPSEYCANPMGSSTNVFPPKSTLFIVTGTNDNGCKATDTISVIYDGKEKAFVPNVFTPNNDQLNDKIGVIDACNIVFLSFDIYNRWGQNVYSGYNLTDKWDGSFNGQPCEMGTYFYLIKARSLEGVPVEFKGDITLVR